MIKVLPSSNPEKEENLLEYAKSIYDMGVEYLHCDVMDGKFVKSTCLDLETITNVRNNCNILLDIHLMVDKPHKIINNYLAIKPNIITVHYEAVKNKRQLKKLSKLIRSKDIMFGVSIKPNTSVSNLIDLAEYIDLILIMSVEPGKSGQMFIDSSIQKIKDARALANNKNIIVEVDGGINLDNYKQIVEAGADFLVMGNAFYKASNRQELLNTIDKHYKNKAQ
ncbi:MAG: ribulose-phosphate 3-epimerase [Clostridiales bacterium]|nr:ribulose-phosphate 3-epimerase [Clostridiales bacterium]